MTQQLCRCASPKCACTGSAETWAQIHATKPRHGLVHAKLQPSRLSFGVSRSIVFDPARVRVTPHKPQPTMIHILPNGSCILHDWREAPRVPRGRPVAGSDDWTADEPGSRLSKIHFSRWIRAVEPPHHWGENQLPRAGLGILDPFFFI